MLVGREAERARIDAALHAARAGRGTALVLRGEPGIGKTALGAYALAEATGMTPVAVRGNPGEGRLPYAALHDVVAALGTAVDAMSAERASTLRHAVGLAAGEPPPPLAVSVATLELLCAAAADRPLVVLVDDAHWIDASSRTVLWFASRRIADEAVVMLFATRPGLLETDTAPVVDVESFDADTTVAYLRALFGAQFDADVARRLHAATGGNPLALRELAAAIPPAQRDGTARLESLPRATHAAALFAAQLEGVGAQVRRVLEVCAASTDGLLGPITAALAAGDVEPGALPAAEATGLVTFDGGVASFRHPLARAAVEDAADPAALRSAHAALAAACADPDVATWHRSHGLIGPDEGVAGELEATAERAEQRGDPVAAAAAWSRSAALSSSPEDRARRALRAGQSYRTAGHFDLAETELLDALAHTNDASRRADVQQTRAHVLVWRGRANEAWAISQEEARAIEGTDPFRAVFMLMQGLLGPLHSGDLAVALEGARECARIAARVGGTVERVGRALHGFVSMLVGDPAGEGMLRSTKGLYPELEPLIPSAPPVLALTSWLGLMRVVVEEHVEAEEILTGTIEWARRLGAVGSLPVPLAHAADLALRTGNWSAAALYADESLRVADELGHPGHRLEALCALAAVETLRGDYDAAEALLTRAADLAIETGAGALGLRVDTLRGLGALGRGDAAAALPALERVDRDAERGGLRHPAMFQYAWNHVEALARCGEREMAGAALERLEDVADAFDGRAAKATAARCRGLLSTSGYRAHFARALELHAEAPMPFEVARTELCFGERLRRDGKVKEARRQLRHALATFAALGAVDWAERARHELRSSGERMPAGRNAADRAPLTPQELRIAMLAAEGRTNREVAAELFLSPKTVENHLGRIYAKLGVRRRGELARLLAM